MARSTRAMRLQRPALRVRGDARVQVLRALHRAQNHLVDVFPSEVVRDGPSIVSSMVEAMPSPPISY